MALGTVTAELTAMNVIAAMTTDTRLRQRDRAVGARCSMTTLAGQPVVCAFERKRSSGVVIEIPQSPVDRHMTFGALGPEAHFVCIVFPMAVDANFPGVMERRRCVAIFAVDLLVTAQ